MLTWWESLYLIDGTTTGLIVKLKIALTENTLNITSMVSLCSKCTAHKGAILNYMLHYWSGSYW